MMANPSIEGFWWFVREREKIRIFKERGDPPPWTNYETLQQYHFCNIRRSLDYGTRWYMEMIVDQPVDGGLEEILWRTMLYRLVNNTEWFEHVGVFTFQDWRSSRQRKYCRERILRAPKPHSPAYIILQAPGNITGRARQLIKVLDLLVKDFEKLVTFVWLADSLEEVWKILQKPYGMGPFIALQVIRDLLLFHGLPFNENDFTYLGPGAKEGLEMLFPTSPANYNAQYGQCLHLFENQPTKGVDEEYVHPPLFLGDVEHCLCEYAKFIKFSNGKGRRRLYKPRQFHEQLLEGAGNV